MKRFLILILLLAVTVPAHAQRDSTQLVRIRATTKGMKIGAVAGTISGLVLGAFGGYLVYALCDTGDCSESLGQSIAAGTLIGGAFGLATGGATGAMIGASRPQYVRADDRRARHVASEIIGGASFAPAFAHPNEGHGNGLGARFSYYFQTEHLAVGPEIGWYSAGTVDRTVYNPCPAPPGQEIYCADTISQKQSVLHANVNARLGTGATRKFEPYVTGGLGYYRWNLSRGFASTDALGYSGGGGLTLRDATRRKAVFAEARVQSNVNDPGFTGVDYGFLTFAIGASVAW